MVGMAVIMQALYVMLLAVRAFGAEPVEESTRVVVTFRSAVFNTLAAAELVPEDVTVVKQYGRRLVLHLGNGSLTPWISGIW